jgi:uroporphyrin-III C-methyltransferase/precorrin-2 dehydrogenase/sirohydrochlorin ferrochelatase
MSMLPIFFAMEKMRVLVIGAGVVAMRKAHTLYGAGADLTVIAPEIHEDFKVMTSIKFIQREIRDTDLDDSYNLAIIATNDLRLNQKLSDLCHAKRILVSRCDDFSQSDFICSEPVEFDPIVLGIYCSGLPEMVRFVKTRLGKSFDTHLLSLARLMAELRPSIKKKIIDEKQRREFFRRFINDSALEKIAEKGIDEFKAEVLRCL